MKPLFYRYESGRGPVWNAHVRFVPADAAGLLVLFAGIAALIAAVLAVTHVVGMGGWQGVAAFLATLLGGMAVLFALMRWLSVPANSSNQNSEHD